MKFELTTKMLDNIEGPILQMTMTVNGKTFHTACTAEMLHDADGCRLTLKPMIESLIRNCYEENK